MALSSFFRRRNHNQGLPTTSGNNARSSNFTFRSNPNDGSARNIRLEKSIVKSWHKTSFATRATYCSLLFFLFLLYMGIRWIRYSNAYIHLNCRITTCELQIMPLGWGRKIRFEFPRRQLLEGVAVKTDAQGAYVEGEPNVNDDYMANRQQQQYKKGKKYSPPGKPSSKGPDANGHYVSYALVLTDQETNSAAAENQVHEGGDYNDQPVKNLEAIRDYLDPLNDDSSQAENEQQQSRYRLVLRKFRIAQSKRRVRTILSKIDAYVKHRRTQLVVKETSPPSWQGILGIVLGLMGALLTLLIGQLWDETPASASGPGVRRDGRTSRSSGNAHLKRTTPAKYEVTTSHPQHHRISVAAKRNTTAVRPSSTGAGQRDRIREAWIQPK
ncbi:hypothetical protein MPSEU_001031900 [Mayamaea pseudoterrestris]|nr:hypothetical protein MPSEU_001031900 [Mayamaea pseudoterrestris]